MQNYKRLKSTENLCFKSFGKLFRNESYVFHKTLDFHQSMKKLFLFLKNRFLYFKVYFISLRDLSFRPIIILYLLLYIQNKFIKAFNSIANTLLILKINASFDLRKV